MAARFHVVDNGPPKVTFTPAEDLPFFEDMHKLEAKLKAAGPMKLSEAIEAVLRQRHKITINAKVAQQHYGVPMDIDVVREVVLLEKAAEMLRLVIEHKEDVLPILMSKKRKGWQR